MDYLIQKVCVDSAGKVLEADPYFLPSGSSLRNLRIGEKLPYYKHDQPALDHPNGYQRHDSYPALDMDGCEIVVNPFYFGPNYSGNGFDIYTIRGKWASAGETEDGGGFQTTFFGKGAQGVVPYNGWILFPASLTSNDVRAENVKEPIAGRYWEQNGEAWHGFTPTSFFEGSETSWSLIRKCSFGGMGGAPVKKIDAIQSVHGYVSKGDPAYESNMASGHLEVFYFTKLYGVTRWESWAPIGQLNNYNQPSEARTQAIYAASISAKPIAEAGQWLQQPSDLPSTPGHQFIAATYAGQDGIKNTYALLDVRDWSAVTLLSSPAFPPPCPNPCQNLLNDFHFENSALESWCFLKTPAGEKSLNPKPMQSKTALDMRYSQTGDKGGVRYLELQAKAPFAGEVYQDIPVDKLKNGRCIACVKLRSDSGNEVMRVLLQEVDRKGDTLSTALDFKKSIPSCNDQYSYRGIHDPGSNASVYLASTLISGGAPLKIDPRAVSLRFVLQPLSAGPFDVVEADVSLVSPGR